MPSVMEYILHVLMRKRLGGAITCRRDRHPVTATGQVLPAAARRSGVCRRLNAPGPAGSLCPAPRPAALPAKARALAARQQKPAARITWMEFSNMAYLQADNVTFSHESQDSRDTLPAEVLHGVTPRH